MIAIPGYSVPLVAYFIQAFTVYVYLSSEVFAELLNEEKAIPVSFRKGFVRAYNGDRPIFLKFGHWLQCIVVQDVWMFNVWNGIETHLPTVTRLAVNYILMFKISMASDDCCKLMQKCRIVSSECGGFQSYENCIIPRAPRFLTPEQSVVDHPEVALVDVLIQYELAVAPKTSSSRSLAQYRIIDTICR